jgi:hypothetical protein
MFPNNELLMIAHSTLHLLQINYALQDNYTNTISLVNVHNSTAPPMLVPIHAAVSLYHLKYLVRSPPPFTYGDGC